MRGFIAVAVSVCCLAGGLAAGGQVPVRPPATSKLTLPGSASTLITVIGNSTGVVDLLVVWRGHPKWWMQSPRSGSAGGGGKRPFTLAESYGPVQLSVELTIESRELLINGKVVELGEDNVVLVDGVDGASDEQVTRTDRVDLGLGSMKDLAPILAVAPQIVTFLRCEPPSADGDHDRGPYLCSRLR